KEWVPVESERSRAWNVFSAAGIVALVIGSGWALRVWLRWEGRQGAGSLLHFATTVGYLAGPPLLVAFLLGAARGWRARESFVPVVAAFVALSAATVASLFVRVSAQYVFVLQPWLAACAGLAFVPPEGAAEEAPAARRRKALLAVLV